MRRGFTLIEIIVVIAIFTMIMSLGLFMTFDTYRGFSSRSERDTVVSLLTSARSAAMANINQTSWGICYIAPNYITFRGTTCTAGAATNIAVPTGGGVAVAGLYLPGVVFTQLSGTTTATTTTITQNGRTSTITVNYEGTITW
jgi:prepilin-type N-terminal cleavage/methylation domain-containing protein